MLAPHPHPRSARALALAREGVAEEERRIDAHGCRDVFACLASCALVGEPARRRRCDGGLRDVCIFSGSSPLPSPRSCCCCVTVVVLVFVCV